MWHESSPLGWWFHSSCKSIIPLYWMKTCLWLSLWLPKSQKIKWIAFWWDKFSYNWKCHCVFQVCCLMVRQMWLMRGLFIFWHLRIRWGGRWKTWPFYLPSGVGSSRNQAISGCLWDLPLSHLPYRGAAGVCRWLRMRAPCLWSVDSEWRFL